MNIMRTFFMLLLISLFSGMSFGQNSIFLLSDRPGHALSANTLAPGQFVLQLGYSYGQDAEEYNTVFFNNILNDQHQGVQSTVRMGLSKTLESYLTIGGSRMRSQIKYRRVDYREEFTERFDPEMHQDIEFGLRREFKNSKGVNFSGLVGFKPQLRIFKFGTMLSTQFGQSSIAINAHLYTDFLTGVGAAYAARYSYMFSTVACYAEVWGGQHNGIYLASPFSAGSGLAFELSPTLLLDLGGNYQLASNTDGFGFRSLYQWSAEIGLTYILAQP